MQVPVRIAVALAVLSASCGFFRKEPPRVLPVRAMRDVVPVVELASPASLLGRCVAFRPDGTLRFKECPNVVAPLFRTATALSFNSGKHELEVLWVTRQADVAGFSGSGGHFHAHESHIQEVHSMDLTTTRLNSKQLEGLDEVCRARASDEVLLVTRAFGGCAVAHRGTAIPGRSPDGGPQVTLGQLRKSGERLGTPRGFEVLGDDSPTGCDGDPTGLAVSVTKLSNICRNFIQPEMRRGLEKKLLELKENLGELRDQLEKARKERNALQAKIDERGERQLAEARAVEGRTKKGKGKRAKPPAPTPEVTLTPREKRQMFQLREKENRILLEIADVREMESTTERRVERYRGEPYADSAGMQLSSSRGH